MDLCGQQQYLGSLGPKYGKVTSFPFFPMMVFILNLRT